MRYFFAFLFLLILPPMIYFPTVAAKRDAEVDRLDEEISELEQRIMQSKAVQRKLVQFHQEMSRLGEELTKLRRILPAEMVIDEIHTLTEAKAADSGMRVTKFEVGASKSTPPLQEQSIEVEVIGSTDATTRFLRDLQDASRILDVSNVVLRPDAGGWRTQLTMTCYAMPDER